MGSHGRRTFPTRSCGSGAQLPRSYVLRLADSSCVEKTRHLLVDLDPMGVVTAIYFNDPDLLVDRLSLVGLRHGFGTSRALSLNLIW